MEGRGRSRARKQRWFSPKRLTSFLLAAAMVCTNIGSDLSTAYAAGASTDVTFEMRGADLTAAVEEAIASENVVAPDDLDFTNGNVDDFNGYLFGEGKLYEAYPEMEGGDVETNMRVFVRVPEDADDMYAMTGDEEVIFLYINNSEDTVQFRSRITYTVNGEEKVKQTDRITVRSYESVYGDEEVNVISEPVNTEDTAEDAADTTAPSEPAAETPEAENPDGQAPETEETEAPAEETPEADAPETEAPAEDPVATESEMTASISKNEAALVAAPAEKATPSELPEEEETTEAETEESAAEEETGEEPETEAPEEEVPAEEVPEAPKATESEIPETEKPESAPKPDYSDLVGIGWSGTAKLYSSTLNKLHALDDVEGWKVEYSITPAGSARIVDGPRGVEDGEDLYFGVKNQIGYAVETVLANGEELTADTVTDNEDGSQTAWYAVYGVTEEQSVDVVMAETGEHPAFDTELTMEDGTVIHIHADAGVLPAGVTAEASVVTGIEEVVKENVEAEAAEAGEEKEVIASLSYNIDLLDADGGKLDDQIWSGVVEVTFTGALIEEHSKEADAVEIMHVETTKDEEPQAEIQAEDVVDVKAVAAPIQVYSEDGIAEVSFEAEHFSTYTVTFVKEAKEIVLTVHTLILGTGEELDYDIQSVDLADQGDEIDVTTIVADLLTIDADQYNFVRATATDSSDETPIEKLAVSESSVIGKSADGSDIALTDNTIYLWYEENQKVAVYQSVEGEESLIQIEQGYIEEHALEINGYDFIEAKVGENPANYIRKYLNKTYWSYVEEDGDPEAAAAVELGTDEKIILYYETHVEKYTIDLQVDNAGNTSNRVVEYPDEVIQGSGFNIQLEIARGYEVDVRVNGTTVSETSAGSHIYEVSANTAAPNTGNVVNVNVTYEKVDRYHYWVDNKNLENWHGASWANIEGASNPSSYGAGEEFSFTVTSKTDYDWRLNSFQINGEDLKVPTEYEITGNWWDGYDYPTATTTLSTGTVVTIQLTEVEGRNTPAYTYTITVKNAYEDIVVTRGNFRNNTWSELMPETVTGVYVEAFRQNNTAGWTKVDVSRPIQYEGQQDRGRTIYFRYNILPGYENANITLIDGDRGSVPSQYQEEGFDGYFSVTKTDTLVVLKIEASIKNYSVAYEKGSIENTVSGLPTDIGSYNIVDNRYIYIPNQIPTAEGYSFQGWKINGSDITYQPGDVVDMNDVVQYASGSEIEFQAQWLAATETQNAYYTIHVWKEDANGDHTTADGVKYSEFGTQISKLGPVGKTVAYFENVENIGEGYVFNPLKSNRETVVEADGSSTINLYYDLRSYNIFYHNVEGAVNNNPDTYRPNEGVSSFNDPTKVGYTFVGWYNSEDTDATKVESIPTGSTGNVNLWARWEIDWSETKTLTATVDYDVAGEIQTEDHIDLTATVWVNDPDTLSTEGVEAKTYTGYKLSQITINDEVVESLPATVDNGDEVVYVYVEDDSQTKDLKATVDYDVAGEIQTEDHIDLTATVWVNDPDTLSTEGVEAKTYTGYKLSQITINDEVVESLPATVDNGDEVVYVYVEDDSQTKDLKATVDYDVAGEIQTEDHIDLTATVWVNDPDTLSTEGVEAKTYTGYKLSQITINDEVVESLPATVDNGDEVVYVYVEDDSQTKDLKATVDYDVAGEIQTEDHIDLTATVWVNDPDTLSTEGVEAKTYTGYKLSQITINDEVVESLPATVDNGDEVVYVYVEDDSQTKDLKATVDYDVAGEIQTEDHIDLTATVWVNDPDTLSTEGVEAKTYTGYKLSQITINGEVVESLPATVDNGDEVVYVYVEDDSQTKDLKATVDYDVAGEIQTEDHIDLTATVWVNDPDTLSTEGVEAKTYTGYKLSQITINDEVVESLPATVDNGDEVVYVYVEDDSQTKDLKATVDYDVAGEIQTEDHIDLTATVWVNDPDTLSTEGVEAKTYTGYKLSQITINDEVVESLPATVDNGDEVVYVYVEDDSQTKDLKATVDYDVAGEIQTEDHIDLTATVWVNDPDTLSTEGVEAKTYTGYKLSQITINDEVVESLPATVDNGDEVVYVYVEDDSQTKDLKATVDYDVAGEIQTEDHIDLTATVWVNDPDTLSTEGVEAKTYTGYKLSQITINDEVVESLPATVDNGDEVVYVYVEDDSQTKDLKATVDYDVAGEIQTEDHIDLTATVWVNDPDTLSTEGVEAKTYTGYKLSQITINDEVVESLPATVDNGDEVVYVYVEDDSQTKDLKATVDYDVAGEIQTEDHIDLTATVWVNDPDTLSTEGVEAKTYTGYKLSQITINDEVVESLPATVDNGDEVVYVYVEDDSQTKDLKATVDYDVAGEIQTEDHIDLTATVWVNDPDTLSTEGVEAKTYTGYKLSQITINGEVVESLPATVDNGDEVVYVYVEDDSQTKDLKATVDYDVAGEIQTEDHIDLTATVWVNDPDTLSTEGVEAKTYTGYKLSQITINDEVVESLPATVDNGDEVVYVYVEDDSQTKDLKATVDYDVAGEIQTEDHIDLTATVWVNDPDTLSTEGVEAKTYTGYKLSQITINDEVVESLPATVDNGDEVVYVYVEDDSQTKDLKATVDYDVAGEIQTEDHIDLTATVWVNDPDTLSTEGVEAKTYTGYKLSQITINDEVVESLPATVDNGDEVVYVYVEDDSQTKDLKATVDYDVAGEIQTEDHIDLTATVWVNDPDTLSTEGVEAKTYTGYKLSQITINDEVVESLPATVDNGDEVVYVYVEDDSQTKDLKATVDYDVAGEIQTEDHIDLTATVWVNDPDTLSTEGVEAKTYTGYKLSQITINDEVVESLPATVDNGDEVVYVYVEDDSQTKDLKATVDYDVAGEIQTEDHIDLTATVWVNDPDTLSTEGVEAKTYIGYVLESITINGNAVESLPATVDNGDAVVYVYVKDANEDEIPDKYQEIVVFAAVNGTVDGATQVEKVVTLVDADGNWAEDGSYTLKAEDIPEAVAATGYDQSTGTWDSEDPTSPAGSVIDRGEDTKVTFTVTFSPADQTYIVQYIDEDTNEALKTQDVFNAKYGDYINGEDHAIEFEGYTFTRATELWVTEDNQINYVFVYYSKDEIGGGEDPNEPDGTPDKYQEIVVFAAVNGTVDGATQVEKVVTLVDADGNWAEDGSYTLKAEDIPEAVAATGYDQSTGTWDSEDPTSPAGSVIDRGEDTKVTFTVTFSPADQTYIVQYIDEDTNEALKTQDVFNAKYGDYINGEDHAIEFDGYTFTRATELWVTEDNQINYVFVYYSKDEIGGGEDPNEPDGTPDKYQEIVVFAAVNGTVDGATQVEKVVTLVDADGNWAEDGSYTLKAEDIPEAVAATGYDQSTGTWDSEDPTSPAGSVIDRGEDTKVTFTVTFSPADQTYIVQYIDEDTNEALKTQDVFNAKYGDYINGEDHAIEFDGYTFTRATELWVTEDNQINYVFVYYSKDEIGGGEDPNEPDGTPDKYQEIVVFAAVNGTVDGATQVEKVVTLVDADGNWAEDGSYTLTAEDIPEAVAATGYDQSTGTWDSEDPTSPAGSVIDRGEDTKVTFTVTFSPADQTYIVQYIDEDTNEALKTQDVFDAKYGDYINGKDHAIEFDGYTFTRATELWVTEDNQINYVFVYYSKDEIGGGEDPNEPDGTPDKYQEIVVFAAVNGTVDGATQVEKVVTLVDADGNWAEDGSYTLTAEDIPEAVAATGYDQSTGTWDSEDPTSPAGSVIDRGEDTKVTFTVTFSPADQTYIVQYIDEDTNEALKTQDVFDAKYGDYINGKDHAIEFEGYTFTRATELWVTEDNQINYVFVYYSKDEIGGGEDPNEPDGTPDKYQEIVVFAAVNGTVDGATQVEKVVTLVDADGNWAEDGSYTLKAEDIPEAVAATGYDQSTGTWDSEDPTSPAGSVIDRGEDTKVTFTVTFSPADQTYIVQYIDEDTNEALKTQDVFDAKYGDYINGKDHAIEFDGYTFTRATELWVTEDNQINYVFVYYSKDEIGGGEDPNEPDGTPDKYQEIVVFAAVNGTVDGATQVEKVVTLVDADGNWAEDGSYTLTAEDIPEAVAATGYDQSTGTWDSEDPTSPAGSVIDRGEDTKVTFTVTFSPADQTYIVQYIDEDTNEALKTQDVFDAKYGDYINGKDHAIEFEGYTFTRATELWVTEDNQINYVFVYYSKDEIGGGEDPNEPDGTPDKYQEIVVFAAVNGTVDGATQVEKVVTLVDADGNWAEDGSYTLTAEDIPEAVAATGYDQSTGTWDSEDPTSPAGSVIDRGEDTKVTFTVTFSPADQTYIVQYIDEDTNEALKTQDVFDAKYGDYINGKDHAIEFEGYTFTRATELWVTEDNQINYVFVYYSKDEKGGEDPEDPGDNVPDKYQLVFTYVSADPTTGDVTGKTMEVKTFRDEAGNYIDVQPTSPVDMDGHGPVPVGEPGYAFAYWTVQGGDPNTKDYTAGMTGVLGNTAFDTDTVFVATFLEDKGGTDDPDTPDGKPDIYQIKFTYVTEDPIRGNFNGYNEVSEVLDRQLDADGNPNPNGSANPTVGVTITEYGRYRFDHWTIVGDTSESEYTTEALRNMAFTTDTTFTAHFRYVSGGGHDGGSPGSGGGGNPYNPSTGGPGEVLIDEGNVPLAPLPTEGTGTTIYDGDVPLAPLPKTGQQSSKTPVMMLLTGLFMAFAALTRRKEEKQ